METEEAISESLRLMKLACLLPEQHKAINAFLSGKDVFVSLPTGYGKSMIYLLLPHIFDRMRGKLLNWYYSRLVVSYTGLCSNLQVSQEVL